MSRVVVFSGGDAGQWRLVAAETVTGEALPAAPAVRVAMEGEPCVPAIWRLRGALSNTRYATQDEVSILRSRQAALARPEALCAVLIPIRKTQGWWDLAQDERRAIFEETSHHTRIGLDYLPAVARRLHHSRDLGEPFDFLTWFEFAPADAGAFRSLTERLRATREWDFVDREVEWWLERVPD